MDIFIKRVHGLNDVFKMYNEMIFEFIFIKRETSLFLYRNSVYKSELRRNRVNSYFNSLSFKTWTIHKFCCIADLLDIYCDRYLSR